MRKTLLLFTTTALALLLAAGTAWAALPAPTVVSTGTVTGTPPVTGTIPPTLPQTSVPRAADITAKFSEAMSTKSLQILNHSTTTPPSTASSNTFYLLKGQFTGSATAPFKNPPRFCSTGTPPATCPDPLPLIPATVSYTAGTLTATLNPTSTLESLTTYTAVVEGANDGDFVAVKDTGGTPMAQDRIFSFTTGL
jgi:Bacterial Ig-like domain